MRRCCLGLHHCHDVIWRALPFSLPRLQHSPRTSAASDNKAKHAAHCNVAPLQCLVAEQQQGLVCFSHEQVLQRSPCLLIDSCSDAMPAAHCTVATHLCEQCRPATGVCVLRPWTGSCLEDEAWSVDDGEVGAVCILRPQHDRLCRHSACTHTQPESHCAALHSLTCTAIEPKLLSSRVLLHKLPPGKAMFGVCRTL